MSPRVLAVLGLSVLAGACAPGTTKRAPSCADSFSMAKATAPESRAKLEPLMMRGHGVPTPFMIYHVCRAIVGGSDAPCDALPPIKLPDGKVFPQICRQDVGEIALAKALITRAPDAGALCERAAGDGEGLVSPGKVKELCAAIVARLDRPEEAAKAVEAYAVGGSTAAAAELSLGLRRTLGDPKACDETTEPEEKHNCGQFAAFRARACGDGPYCLLMAGGGAEVCEAQAARARAQWCEP